MILDPRSPSAKSSLDNENAAMVIYWLHCKAGCWQHWIQCSWTTFLIRTAAPPCIKPTSTLGPLPLTTGPSPQSNGIYKHGKTWEKGRSEPGNKMKKKSHKSHNWRIWASIGHIYHGHCAVVIPPLRRVISLLQGQIGNPTSPSQWCVEIALAFLGSLCQSCGPQFMAGKFLGFDDGPSDFGTPIFSQTFISTIEAFIIHHGLFERNLHSIGVECKTRT